MKRQKKERRMSWDLDMCQIDIGLSLHCALCVLFHWFLITRMRARMLSHLSHVWLFATLGVVALQAPLSMQEYWSGLPRPSPGDLTNQGLNLQRLKLLRCRWILYRWATREAPVTSLWECHYFPDLPVKLPRRWVKHLLKAIQLVKEGVVKFGPPSWPTKNASLSARFYSSGPKNTLPPRLGSH